MKYYIKHKAPLIIALLITLMFLSTSVIGTTQTNPTLVQITTTNPAAFEQSTYRLLIITPAKYTDELEPLVEHKETVGMKPRLVTLDEVYDAMYWYGRDEPEKIKYYIMHAVQYWGVEYILLVGNYKDMPIRYVENQDIEGYPEPRFVSELYYADLFESDDSFSTWDTNGNGVYGEWIGETAEDPDIDLYPDIAVGRLACINKKEVRTCVNKIITYERNTYGEEWFNRIAVCAGDTYLESENPNWTGYEGEENALHVLENMTAFEQIILFASDGSFNNKWDVIRTISKGLGFMYFDGHANPRTWGTHKPNDEEFITGLNVGAMPFLHNGRKTPIVVVGGCHNNQFDVGLEKLFSDGFWYMTWIPECWGWKLTQLAQGGSIATIGCTGLGMTKEDKDSFSGAGDFLEPSFFYTYTNNNLDHLGDVWAQTISRYLDHYPIDWETPAAWDYAIDAKTCQQWVLLGDPSLMIGGYPPETFESNTLLEE